jgi:6-pyruvoyltetrahydropterin/6-carboxytetrahydropterin synthase
MGYRITRQIGIDAAHRIAQHGSKCRNLHGHRYMVEASCQARSGKLHETGEEGGMVLDFGFLKEEMLTVIDETCDHGLILDVADRALLAFFAPDSADADTWMDDLAARVATQGYVQVADARLGQKLYLIPYPPTAECLARHWFERLAPRVAGRSGGWAELTALTVWETPNCYAEFTGGGMF